MKDKRGLTLTAILMLILLIVLAYKVEKQKKQIKILQNIIQNERYEKYHPFELKREGSEE